MSDERAVTVIEQVPTAVVEWNLDDWPTETFNRLIPTQSLGIANEFIRPVIQVVQLDLEGDTYSSRDLKDGHRAPNAKGLAKLADAAGVTFVDELRLDDGSDPMRAYVRVTAVMVDPTGMKRSVQGARDYHLDSQAMTDNQRARAKAFVYEHAATRARHRALRLLLSLAQSYPIPELRKPFAVVRFLPNTQHPEVREIYKGALASSVTALFGPPEQRPQLGAGQPAPDLSHLDDEEPASQPPLALPAGEPAAADTDSGSAASAAPGPSAGVEAPDWMQPPAQPEAKAEPAAAAAASPLEELVRMIRSSATDEGAPKGKATGPQLDLLRRVFDGLGEGRGVVVAGGIRALFGPEAVQQLTAAQARAIALAADSDEQFLEHWRALAEVRS